jgi:DNA-3-methyladenine glycosylase II
VRTFGARLLLPVRGPFRLDLTSDALRRLASNVVDVVAADGVLYRALRDERGAALVAIRQPDRHSIEVRATGRYADRWLPVVARMLGTAVDLRDWYARSRGIAWLRPVAIALRGLKPPRYPTLWEACAHAILFQQISIFAAAAIMRRAVEALGEPVTAHGIRTVVFPPPERWLEADQRVLRAAGLSANKIAHVRATAAAFADRSVDEEELGALPTPEAAQRLCRLQGIGPWSAALVLLRGLGRLDTFPGRDSGVARSLGLVAGRRVDEPALLEKLGPVRGMLYYHLLLARLRNLVPAADGRRGHD